MEVPRKEQRFDFLNETEVRVPLPRGPFANTVVLTEVGPNRYRDITHAVDLFYEHADDWELVLVSALPLTGNINIS